MELCNSENEVMCRTEKKGGMEFEGADYSSFPRVLSVAELYQKIEENSRDVLILRCRMYPNGVRKSGRSFLNRSCTMITTRRLDESSYIRNVTYSEHQRWSRRLSFPIDEKLVLVITFKNGIGDIAIEITPESEKINLIPRIKCEIILLDYDESEKVSNHDVFSFSENYKIWYFPSFLKKALLGERTLDFDFKFNFAFPNSIISRVFYAHETIHLNLPFTRNSLKNTSSTDSLMEDLRKMLLTKEHSDVSFCVGSEVVSAHKFMLASRSPVFSAMFNQQMSENETGMIHIQDMDVQTLKLFLEFVYTGEVEDCDWERMLELLLAADKYQVPSLKEKCSRFLKDGFSTDSVCDVVSVADRVGEHSLKEAAVYYIKTNYAQIFGSPKWSLFIKQNVELCAEIFNCFSENLKVK